MHATPNFLSDRPNDVLPPRDVLSDVLGAVHLTTAMFGRLELRMPWQLRIPQQQYLSFYVVAEGTASLQLDEEPDSLVIPLAPGDAVVLPRGSAHVLYDADHSITAPQDLDYTRCPGPHNAGPVRFGGAGPVTSLVTGHFTFGGVTRNVLIDSLPTAIHLPADAAASPPLGGVVAMLANESITSGPGSAIALAQLADLLLIHALRYWMSQHSKEACGLPAIADPAIGAALRLLHAKPTEAWTVARLAASVSMSRSAFAARFTDLVGDSPLQYLARWRMSLAARLLSDEQLSVDAVAGRVGYTNPLAFAKAFTRIQGEGPGAFRRRARGGHVAGKAARPTHSATARRPR